MKAKLANVALFIGTLILLFLRLSLVFALIMDWEYVNYRSPQDKFTGYHAYDAELGWVPKEQRGDSGGTTVTIVKGGIRSNGREEVWDGTGEPNLAVADSFTFGEFVPDSETWPAQLEKLSGRRVINGGVDGYGVDQISPSATFPRPILVQHCNIQLHSR